MPFGGGGGGGGGGCGVSSMTRDLPKPFWGVSLTSTTNEGRSSEPRRDLRVFFSGGGGGSGGWSGDCGVSCWWNFESGVFFSRAAGTFLVDLRDEEEKVVVVVPTRTCSSPNELLGRFPEVVIVRRGSESGTSSVLAWPREFRVDLRAAGVVVEISGSGICSFSAALRLASGRFFGAFLVGVSSTGAGVSMGISADVSAGASMSFSSAGVDMGLGIGVGADSTPAEARLCLLRVSRALRVSLGVRV